MAKNAAIVLAAGQGKRMNSTVKKQFLELLGHPILYYTIKAFQESFIDEIILVGAAEDLEYLQEEYVENYRFTKIKKIVAGGKERYHSVACGLRAIEQADYVFIHDGARAFVTEAVLERCLSAVEEHGACVAAMPVKDTIKIADENGFSAETPKRDLLWMVQTPQTFAFPMIKEAYEELLRKENELLTQGIRVTDDAMVVELFTKVRVKLVEGSYENIKVTTPDDLATGEMILGRRKITDLNR